VSRQIEISTKAFTVLIPLLFVTSFYLFLSSSLHLPLNQLTAPVSLLVSSMVNISKYLQETDIAKLLGQFEADIKLQVGKRLGPRVKRRTYASCANETTKLYD